MALTKIGTDGVKDDAVTSDKVADTINLAIAANTAKTQTTINNNADNRIITGSGTANTLNGESGFTHNPSTQDTQIDGSNNAPVDLIIANTNNSQNAATARLSIQAGDNANNGGQLELECNGQYHTFESRSNGTLYISNNGTEALSLDNSNNLHLTSGTFVVGTSGEGLSFQNTSDAAGMTSELLDDYEEGTYTAHFNIEGQGNMSMSGRVGLYVRVGQMVTVMGGGTVASVSGASSGTAIQFTNLPFPIHTTSSNVGHPFPVLLKNMDSTGLGNMAGNQPYQFIGRLFTDNTSGRIEAIRADGAQDAVNSGLALATNTDMHYMFTYRTDA